jgi:hypothetical protein
MKVEVVSVKDAGYYKSEYASGSTVKVTLKRGEDFATCDGMLIWEEELAEEAFDEWTACAIDGEEGYSAMLFENDKYTFYGAN